MPSAYSDTERILTPDHRTLHCMRWQPAGNPRGIVLLLHGIESHPGWFEGTCRRLAGLGYLVAAPARRGSGEDTVARGDIDRYARWIEDVRTVARHVSAAHPGLPLHLMGISWGGKLACACAAENASWIRSLILLSPGLEPRVDLSLPKKLAVAFCGLLCPSRRFALPIMSEAMFTANEGAQAFIRQDPLRLKQVTARFLVENVKLDAMLRRRQRLLRLPVLLLLSGEDAIIDLERTRRRLRYFSSERRQILQYPGTQHTLEFEDNPDLWRKDVLSWLDSF